VTGLFRPLILTLLLRPLPVLALFGVAVLSAGGLGMSGLLRARVADAAHAIEWGQLMPAEAATDDQGVVRGVVLHGQLDPKTGQPKEGGVVRRFDGERVRIGGYVVPLAFDGVKVVMFLLVPYAGACIHVPPPPANQIIYVIAKEGIELGGDQFRAVSVTGTMKAVELSTALADAGYQIVADQVAYAAD
jgi:hypothetical protein